jgi:hypothetical protein
VVEYKPPRKLLKIEFLNETACECAITTLNTSVCDELWIIESSVLLNDNKGQNIQEVIKEFPDRAAETLDECIMQLSQAISDLANSADSTIESMTDGSAG